MTKGIALQGTINIRREPAHTAEMVSQLLFGETCQIHDSRDQWWLVSLDFDGTEGWLMKSCLSITQPGMEPENSNEGPFRMVSQPIVMATDQHGDQLLLPAGSIWPGEKGNRISLLGKVINLKTEDGLIAPSPNVDPGKVGKGLISIPHLWGGRSGFGFDAPGLVQMLGRMMGLSLPRTCLALSEAGTAVNFIHEIKKGDLAFFDNPAGEIVHVGMALGNGRILHASGQVRIDRLDQHGIFNAEKDDYTHKLRVVKRL